MKVLAQDLGFHEALSNLPLVNDTSLLRDQGNESRDNLAQLAVILTSWLLLLSQVEQCLLASLVLLFLFHIELFEPLNDFLLRSSDHL